MITIEGDPEWLPEDRDAAVVYQQEQALTCPSCGTAPWEWEENEDAWWADTYRCPGCERVDAMKRTVRDRLEQAPPSDEDGLEIRLFKTPPRPRE